ncbi:MAG: flavodoxin family protein [Planctomycetes bacterium]|nr:flavodoxin family protein [Planctomycetota bacterium]
MKVVAFNGSPRPKGNTSILIGRVFDELKKEGIETELVSLAGSRLCGCTACYGCVKRKDGTCSIKDDMLNDCVSKMVQADGIILGSPTYFTNVTAEMKALIDRAGLVAKSAGLLNRKVGAAVVAVRRGGATFTFDALNHFFQINNMFVVGSCYWNFAIGREIGEVEKDEEGLKTMKELGQNMAWILKKIAG